MAGDLFLMYFLSFVTLISLLLSLSNLIDLCSALFRPDLKFTADFDLLSMFDFIYNFYFSSASLA